MTCAHGGDSARRGFCASKTFIFSIDTASARVRSSSIVVSRSLANNFARNSRQSVSNAGAASCARMKNRAARARRLHPVSLIIHHPPSSRRVSRSRSRSLSHARPHRMETHPPPSRASSRVHLVSLARARMTRTMVMPMVKYLQNCLTNKKLR